MKNYLNFETDIKNLEEELDKLKDPYNQEGLSEVDTSRISKVEEEIKEKALIEKTLTKKEGKQISISVARNCPSLIKVVPIDSKVFDNLSPSSPFESILFFFENEKANNLNKILIANGGF